MLDQGVSGGERLIYLCEFSHFLTTQTQMLEEILHHFTDSCIIGYDDFNMFKCRGTLLLLVPNCSRGWKYVGQCRFINLEQP